MSRRLHVGPVAATVAGLVIVIGTFLPWLRTGSSSRSSYDLLGLFDRIEVADDGMVALLVRWWPLLPMLVTIVVWLAWARRHGWAVTVGVVAATYAGGIAAAMVVAARRTPVRLGPGPWVTVVGASGLLLAVAVGVLIGPRRTASIRPEPPVVGSVPSARADT